MKMNKLKKLKIPHQQLQRLCSYFRKIILTKMIFLSFMLSHQIP